MKDFRLECFCFLLSCISKISCPCSVITPPFNSDGLLRRILRWSFCECMNYFSFELVGAFRIFQFVFGACRLGSFGTDLYLFNQWVWCLLYKQFWICNLSVSVFVSCFHF